MAEPLAGVSPTNTSPRPDPWPLELMGLVTDELRGRSSVEIVDIPCVGAIVRDDEGQILLVHRGRAPDEGLWSLPGGRVEAGETDQEAVHREVQEETGLDVEVEDRAGSVVLPASTPGDRYLVTDYFARVRPGASMHPTPGDDAAEARWVTASEFLTLELTPDLADTLTAWRVWP